jgi:alpha-1,3-rhamnosyl/mannosyltransferase
MNNDSGAMRIVVNECVTRRAMTGIGHYTSQLTRCLRLLAKREAFVSFPDAWIDSGYSLLRAGRRAYSLVATARNQQPPGDNGKRSSLRSTVRHGAHTLLSQYFRACVAPNADIYHEPNVIPLDAGIPTVTTIHDLSVIRFPTWHPADRVRFYEQHFHRGLKAATHFLVGSDAIRDELIRDQGISPERVTRAAYGVRPGLMPASEEEIQLVLAGLGLPPCYLLHVGTIEPRKNLQMLLRAYGDLPTAVRDRCPLLLVGGWGWNSSDIAERLRASQGRGVIHLGYVAERHLSALYSGARALLFPSWYEGFGLPPLEMMACGGAVIASRIGAVAETVGSKAQLIDPHDLDGWRSAIARIVSDDDWRRSLRRGVRALARPFTWERCASDTLAAYHLALGKRDMAETRSTRIAG